MPGRRTRKRRAGKKLANNVASVLRKRIENIKEQEASNAVAAYILKNPEQFYNANENYNGNAEIIATTIPINVPPVRRRYTAHGENQRIMNLMRATAIRQINPEFNFRPKSTKSKTRRSKRY